VRDPPGATGPRPNPLIVAACGKGRAYSDPANEGRDKAFCLARTSGRKESIIGTEIELKLAARPGDLPALARMLEARAGGTAQHSRARLVSTYFDTPDQALAKRGLVLRVRERDGRFVQTVKSIESGAEFGAQPGGGALSRGEWEDVVDGAWPDPRAFESGCFLQPETAGRLVPLFRTEIVRDTIALAPAPGTHIEAAIDCGHLDAPSRAAGEPISEVELELKSGQAAALYDVALELLAVAPVRLERRSKAERGYRLAGLQAAPAVAVQAARIDLDRDLGGHVALPRIGFACLEQMLHNEAFVLAGRADGIHQMRVAVRRLRAVLSAFAGMLPGEQRRWASQELRWLGAALGATRNLDVFETALVAPARQALGDSAGLQALSAAAARRRAAAHALAAEAIRSTRYTGLVLRLLRWFESCGWRRTGASRKLDRPIGRIATGILDRRRRIVKRYSGNLAGRSPEERHELRIALKKLRYATEALAGLFDSGEVGRFLAQVKRVQDDLGDANDVQVGRAIVAALAGQHDGAGIAAAGEAMVRWHERRLANRAAKLRRRVDRLNQGDPFRAT
jgi:triphosphatase